MFHLTIKKLCKILSYNMNKSVKNGVTRIHLIAGNHPTHSKNLKLLEKLIIIEGSSVKPYSAGELSKPDNPTDKEAIE